MPHNKKLTYTLFIINIILLSKLCEGKILRNNKLMSEMVTNFQRPSAQEQLDSTNGEMRTDVVTLMQSVLCRNFPDIPCNIIVKDDKLKNLIQKSIAQINNKRAPLEETTKYNYQVTMFPRINSEDLSSFLEVKHTGYFQSKPNRNINTKRHKNKKHKTSISNKKLIKKLDKGTKKKGSHRTMISGSRKMTKFYPHKIKYKDKYQIPNYSEEKNSMSMETPVSYKRIDDNKNREEPVWRIDYAKHGEPSLNIYAMENKDELKGKIIKNGPNVLVDDSLLQRATRKELVHPDLYIKKNIVRKKLVDNMSSFGV